VVNTGKSVKLLDWVKVTRQFFEKPNSTPQVLRFSETRIITNAHVLVVAAVVSGMPYTLHKW
jgi:hypothetical protein